jgi:hypothetical protein
VFESLFAELVSGQMIPFAMGGSGAGVGVGCHVVKFRGSIVRTLGHDDLLPVRCKPQGKGLLEDGFATVLRSNLYPPRLRGLTQAGARLCR